MYSVECYTLLSGVSRAQATSTSPRAITGQSSNDSIAKDNTELHVTCHNEKVM